MTQIIIHGQNLDIFDVTHLDVSNATNIDYTFHYTKNITTLRGLENWNTRNFTTLSNGFKSLYYISNVNELANWNTSNVTSMHNTFYDCSSLTDISGLSNWNTSKVTDMTSTFFSCRKLAMLNGLENWNVDNVTAMNYTFASCNSLTDISNLSNWNTSKVTDMTSTFAHCSNLTDVSGLSNWNVDNVTSMNGMFFNCSSLTDISGLSNWNVDNVTAMYNTFYGCSSLTDISALDSWNWNSRVFNKVFGPDVPNMNLGTHNVSHSVFINTFPWSANYASFNNWYFTNCSIRPLCSAPSRTTYLNFSISGKFLTLRFFGGNETFNANHIFANIQSTGSINAQNVNFLGAYCGCTGLTTINNIVATNCNRADYMFYNCRSLVNANNLSLHFASDGYLLCNNMFGNCIKLNDVTCMENWTFTQTSTAGRPINITSMFYMCNNLSDDSLYAITNFFIKFGDYVNTNCMNLYNSNSYSPFYNTNISLATRLDTNQTARLTSAGYKFN